MRAYALILLCSFALAAKDKSEAQKLFEANCLACHQLAKMIAGPTLYEINQIYEKKPQGIVDWAKKPGRKRKTGIAMPAMAHLGDKNLTLIANYMLKAGSKVNVREVQKLNQIEEKQGRIQRTFMPNSGVISFAIRFSDKLSLCWDAEKAATRYIWRGVINTNKHFTSNGKSIPKIIGDSIYTNDDSPFINIDDPIKFLGYNVSEEGLPEFLYKRGPFSFKEKLAYDEGNIIINYQVSGPSSLEYRMPQIKGFKSSSSVGSIKGGVLKLKKEEIQSFTITLSEEK